MASLSNPEAVKQLLRCRGNDEGFNWRLIYTYTNAANGERAFALFNDPRYDDMNQSPYVSDPELLMEDGYLTQRGAEFLGVSQQEFNNAFAEKEPVLSYEMQAFFQAERMAHKTDEPNLAAARATLAKLSNDELACICGTQADMFDREAFFEEFEMLVEIHGEDCDLLHLLGD